MSNNEPDVQIDPLALVALSGLPTPPPTKPPTGKKTLAEIAAEILGGGE